MSSHFILWNKEIECNCRAACVWCDGACEFLRTHMYKRICHSIQIYAAAQHQNHQSVCCLYRKFRCHWRYTLDFPIFFRKFRARCSRLLFILCDLCAPSTTYFEIYDKIDVFFFLLRLFLFRSLHLLTLSLSCRRGAGITFHVWLLWVEERARARERERACAWRLNISSATISIEFTDGFVVAIRCRMYI